jgi:hypothetical protein
MQGISCAFVFLSQVIGAGLPRQAADRIHFYENCGQWPIEIRYGMWLDGGWVGVKSEGVVMHLVDPENSAAHARVEFGFEGSSPEVVVEGIDQEPGVHHAYLGNDPTKWITNVRTFEHVRLSGVYQGIDLVLREQDGRLKYDVHLSPGADLDRFAVIVEGTNGLEIDDHGDLVIETPLRTMRQPLPVSWEDEGGSRRPVDVRYRLLGEGRFAFEALDRDPSLQMVIDPELLWSTYWGGSGGILEEAVDVDIDANGDVTVVGKVEYFHSFMTPETFQSPYEGTDDIYVAKFDLATGRVVYSARIGSSTADEGGGVSVDAAGRATVVGWERQGGGNFPTTPGAFDTVKHTTGDAAVVFRLSPDGGELEYGTYLESTLGSQATAVATASTGAAIVTGIAFSNDFPTTPGAFNTTGGSGPYGFVARLDPTGSFLEWSTFLAALASSTELDLEIDTAETAYIGGTGGLSFPVTPGAFQTQWKGKAEGFVTALAPDGASLTWSTFLGGSGSDYVWDLALMPSGDVITTGWTESDDFPVTAGAFQTIHAGGFPYSDVFVARLDATGSSLEYATFLGGDVPDKGIGVDADASGIVTVVGFGGGTFPATPGAFATTPKSSDAIVSRLHPHGSHLLYSTFLGGVFSVDGAAAVSSAPNGVLTVVGSTAGGGFPTTPNAMFPQFIGGQYDSFITTFYPYLQGIKITGTSVPACLGPLQLNATAMPIAGQPFSVYCSQAPPDADGVLLVRQPGQQLQVLQVQSDSDGFAETSLGSLPSTPGAVLRCRYRFRNPAGCAGAGTISMSNILIVTTQ